MARIAVVTDSAACIPARLVQQYSIHVVPFELVWDGRSFRDGVDITPGEVYRLSAVRFGVLRAGHCR